jgi:hypothetical protein
MKVTREIVKLVESDQRKYGTKIALENLLWLQAKDQLKDLGVKKLKTIYIKGK